jgi:hypothetical protein
VDAYGRLGIDFQPTYAETIERCREEYELADLVLTPSENSFRSFAEEGFDLQRVVRCPFASTWEKRRPASARRKNSSRCSSGRSACARRVHAAGGVDKARLDGELWLAVAARRKRCARISCRGATALPYGSWAFAATCRS